MTLTPVGYAGEITDDNWRVMATATIGAMYGVDDSASFRATAGSGDRAISLAPGGAFGLGVRDYSDAPITLTGAPVSSGSRWDMVVLRRDWDAGTTTPLIITGSATKVLPTRNTGFGAVNDQPIALVRFAAGQSVAQEIVDLRCIPGDGGVVAFDPLTLTYLDRVGTQVRIADTLWTRSVNGTGSPLWIPTDVTDTGWVNVPLGPKWSAVGGYPLVVRRLGSVAQIRGAAKAQANASFGTLGTVPSRFRPTGNVPLGATYMFSRAFGELFLETTGRLWIDEEYRTGTNPTGNVVMIHGTWFVG